MTDLTELRKQILVSLLNTPTLDRYDRARITVMPIILTASTQTQKLYLKVDHKVIAMWSYNPTVDDNPVYVQAD